MRRSFQPVIAADPLDPQRAALHLDLDIFRADAGQIELGQPAGAGPIDIGSRPPADGDQAGAPL